MPKHKIHTCMTKKGSRKSNSTKQKKRERGRYERVAH